MMPDQLGHMLYTYEKSNRTSIDTLSLDIGACEPTGRRVGLRAINIIPTGGVALKWFADDIATKLWKVKLVFSLSRIVTHDRVRHVGEHDYEDCWGVEGKPEIREQLNKELSILSKGSDTCKQCVRSKIDEGSWDPLLAAGYMSRESSEESALDEAGDETAPTYADEEDK
ncbi:hypothetical protein CDV57_06713 [Aspergillus fumigatus]|nr:hypothetical protein CDV57_06713 [Aspergillus fumigatus]